MATRNRTVSRGHELANALYVRFFNGLIKSGMTLTVAPNVLCTVAYFFMINPEDLSNIKDNFFKTRFL